MIELVLCVFYFIELKYQLANDFYFMFAQTIMRKMALVSLRNVKRASAFSIRLDKVAVRIKKNKHTIYSLIGRHLAY